VHSQTIYLLKNAKRFVYLHLNDFTCDYLSIVYKTIMTPYHWYDVIILIEPCQETEVIMA